MIRSLSKRRPDSASPQPIKDAAAINFATVTKILQNSAKLALKKLKEQRTDLSFAKEKPKFDFFRGGKSEGQPANHFSCQDLLDNIKYARMEVDVLERIERDFIKHQRGNWNWKPPSDIFSDKPRIIRSKKSRYRLFSEARREEGQTKKEKAVAVRPGREADTLRSFIRKEFTN